MGRVLAQEFGCQTYKIVQPACRLCRSRSRDYRHDDEHHVDRQVAGLHPETEHKDEDTHHAVDPESNAADTRTFEDKGQHNGKLYEDNSCRHIHFSLV